MQHKIHNFRTMINTQEGNEAVPSSTQTQLKIYKDSIPWDLPLITLIHHTTDMQNSLTESCK
jgi:hypothetical protein